MMRIILLILFASCSFYELDAQKQLVNFESGKDWPNIKGFEVSDDGKYVCYNIEKPNNPYLVLQSVCSQWKMTIVGGGHGFMVDKMVVFKSGDSLGILELANPGRVIYINDIGSFQILRNSNGRGILLYHLRKKPDQLIIRHIGDGKETIYSSVVKYWTSRDGKVIVTETNCEKENNCLYDLNWIDIDQGVVKRIWRGFGIASVIVGESDSQCVFAGNINSDTASNEIWFYKNSDDAAKDILTLNQLALSGDLIIGKVIFFNERSNQVFFYLIKPGATKRDSSTKTVVEVWSYRDAMPYSEKLYELANSEDDPGYKAVLNLKDGSVIRLEYDDEMIITPLMENKVRKCVLGVKKGTGDLYNEWNWNHKSRISVFLVSLEDGSRHLIASEIPSLGSADYVLSYNENFVFYYDPYARNYCSYRVSDGTCRNLTRNAKAKWTSYDRLDEPKAAFLPYPIAGFIKNTDDILVYDQNNIFRLDPTKTTPSENLTRYLNHSNKLVFRVMPGYGSQEIEPGKKVCMSIFNRENKMTAIKYLQLDSTEVVSSVFLEPYAFNWDAPIKAKDTDVYFVSRMSALEFPNIFCTSDFVQYKPITDLHPQKSYNWLTVELVKWRNFKGEFSEGLLYKPENYDPRKRYPLIVYCYERLSDNLNKFLLPQLSDGRLNVPFYVSHGYLVFMPDIHYKIGWPGESAYSFVFSGVMSLTKRRYVDSQRIGIQGISFGGFETNYIITHCHLFKAAMSSSGMSDFISAYGSIIGDGSVRQRQYELYRDRIGASLWQARNLYIANSPVLRADKVTTPVLMMANRKDDDVPWQQGIEFFTALRRLGKKAWLLQYDQGGHTVGGEAAKDLSYRMFQFFNYYLKSEAPPKWMTESVPASMKRVDRGFEPDNSGKLP